MGTNYYLHEKVCDKCGHAERKVHVGKSSGGWTFSFRGYRHDHEQPQIRSYKDWLAYLEAELANGAVLKDEYGETVSLDAFKELVEAKRGARLNHTLYCRDHHPEYADRDCWLDGEGNSFTGSEFS